MFPTIPSQIQPTSNQPQSSSPSFNIPSNSVQHPSGLIPSANFQSQQLAGFGSSPAHFQNTGSTFGSLGSSSFGSNQAQQSSFSNSIGNQFQNQTSSNLFGSQPQKASSHSLFSSPNQGATFGTSTLPPQNSNQQPHGLFSAQLPTTQPSNQQSSVGSLFNTQSSPNQGLFQPANTSFGYSAPPPQPVQLSVVQDPYQNQGQRQAMMQVTLETPENSADFTIKVNDFNTFKLSSTIMTKNSGFFRRELDGKELDT